MYGPSSTGDQGFSGLICSRLPAHRREGDLMADLMDLSSLNREILEEEVKYLRALAKELQDRLDKREKNAHMLSASLGEILAAKLPKNLS